MEWIEAAVRPPRVIASAPTQSEWLPFRRRDFEVDALARELIARAGAHGLSWGRSLPRSESERIAASLPDAQRVHFVCAAGHGDAMRLEIQEQLARVSGITCTGSAEQVAATCEQAVDAATHVIIILTDTSLPDGAPWLRSGSIAERQLVHALRPAAIGGKQSREIITIYDKPKGLDSTVFGLEGVASDSIKTALWGHEALVFRSKSTAPEYERKSMIHEIVRRMRSKKAEFASTAEPLLLEASRRCSSHAGKEQAPPLLRRLSRQHAEESVNEEVVVVEEEEEEEVKSGSPEEAAEKLGQEERQRQRVHFLELRCDALEKELRASHAETDELRTQLYDSHFLLAMHIA